MSATVLVWIASAVGALLFAGVGFLLARLSGEPPPAKPALGSSQEAARSAELAKLRMDLDARIQRVASLEVASESATAQVEAQRAEAERRTAEAERLRSELAVAQQAAQAAQTRAQTAQHQAVSAEQLAQRAKEAAAQAASTTNGATAATKRKLDSATRELAKVKRQGENTQAEREVLQGEYDREKLTWRRREDELEAILESLTKERDSAFQQVSELERVVGERDEEPTNVEVSSAQFELLKEMLKKAEARAKQLEAEVKDLYATGSHHEFDDPEKTRRKPSTLMGMKPPPEDDGRPMETQEFERPKTLLGVQDPAKLYQEAQAEIDKVRAELEKALFEVQYWKNQTEKLTVEASSTRRRQTIGSQPQGKQRARASVGLKPTATTGRRTMERIEEKDVPDDA